MYIVSACLAGIRCRYDGRCNRDDTVYRLVTEGKAVPLCPEVLGGLSIPRVPCEIILHGGEKRVINRNGEDMTGEFVAGARKTLQIAKILGVEIAILKSKSPSCGCGSIYDGTFSGRLIEGDGITCKMLKDNGIKVYTEDEWRSKYLEEV